MKRDEKAALIYLGEGNSTAACHVQRRCEHSNAAMTRRMLKRLERRGLVEGVRSGTSGRVYWWRLTDAGRGAIGFVE